MKKTKQYLDDYMEKSSVKKKVNWDDYNLESEYEYKDQKGNVLWYKRKYRHKNGKDKTLLSGCYEGKTWKSGLGKDVDKPLYRLPELIASKEKNNFILEGEKDTDNLRAWGYTAVCSPFGAKYWDKEYNSLFIGKEVFLIPDNDKDGQFFTQKIGKNLIKVASSVRVLRLPDAKDFSEWKDKAKNNTEEKFLMLASEAEEWKPEEKEKGSSERYKAISLTDFLEQTPDKIPYLIGKGLLPKQGYLMIAGKAKEGKTKMALMFALCLALGLPIFIREDNLTGMFPIPEKAKTLYLYREAEGLIGMTLESQIKGLENLFKIKISKEARDRVCLKYPPKELYLDIIPGRIILENIIKANPVDLVVIDPVSKFFARDMNKMPPVIATTNLLEEIGREYNCSFILIHHLKKELTDDPFDAITGSATWRNCYSSGLVLQRRYEGRADVFKKVTFEFRNAETPDFITTRRDNDTSLFFEVTEEEALKGLSTVTKLVKMIEDNFKEPVSYTKITNLAKEKWGVTPQRIAKLLREAVKEQSLEKTGSERDTRYAKKTQKDLAL